MIATNSRVIGLCYQFVSSDIVGSHNTLKFIKQSLPKFRKLKTENFDLTKALRYYISGLEMPYLEAEFSTLFTSLECIKSLYAKQIKIDKIVSSNKFKNKISDAIKKEIIRLNENVIDFPEDEMIKKIPELNRTSISTIIDKLTIEYNIELKSFYPKKENVTLINTRNRITHDSKNVEMNILFKEYFRLRMLLEILILKILGWDDLTKLLQSDEMQLVTLKDD